MPQMYRAQLDHEPNLISLAEQFPNDFPALLNSHVINSSVGRYSILFKKEKDVIYAYDKNQLEQLFKTVDQKISLRHIPDMLPFYSGWFLYLSYASIKAWEDALVSLQCDKNQPLGIAIRCRSAVIVDHQKQQSWVVADSHHRIDQIKSIIYTSVFQNKKLNNQFTLLSDEVDDYIQKVNQIKKYIVAGDVYQVNLARKWNIKADKTIDVFSLYRSVSAHNPAPFAGLLHLKNFSIISSSPERLVKVENRNIESRPIAGTRPRSTDKKMDDLLIKELISNLKEQAEHVMLIDLERNDLGRVCEIGSVKVDEFMHIESYAKVHHIVSNVIGKLSSKTTYVDVIKATFPGGTITGCPKIRCMQIIDELEDSPRGAYTGSMGYITDDGRMDLNILIRTFTLANEQLSLHAGAGIVYDSIAKKEAQESYVKAEALINSLR